MEKVTQITEVESNLRKKIFFTYCKHFTITYKRTAGNGLKPNIKNYGILLKPSKIRTPSVLVPETRF